MWTCLRARIGGSSDFVVGEHSLFHCSLCSYMFFTHVFKNVILKGAERFFTDDGGASIAFVPHVCPPI